MVYGFDTLLLSLSALTRATRHLMGEQGISPTAVE
jgi:hypothetical protein